MLFLPMAITKAWADQEKHYLNHLWKAWGQNFTHMHASNISIKLQKIVLIMAFAATHALFYSLDIKIFTLLKRVRTPVALNETAHPALSVRG